MGRINAKPPENFDDVELDEIPEADLTSPAPVRKMRVVLPAAQQVVYLRSLNAEQFVSLSKFKGQQIYAAICLAVCDAQGRSKYECHPEMFEKLRGMDAKDFDYLATAVSKFCLAGDIDEEIKNLEATRDD